MNQSLLNISRVLFLLMVLVFFLMNPQAAVADGMVRIEIKGNDIIMTGDNNSNFVQLFNTGSKLEIRGINSTTVDVTLTDLDTLFVGKLKVKLKNGNNFFQINAGITFNGKVLIKAGSGNDEFDIFAGIFKQKASISSGKGDDKIDITRPEFDDKVKVKAGGGNDDLYLGLYFVTCDKPEFSDMLTVKMGGGDDTVTVDCDALKDVSAVLSGGGGTDTITPEPAVLEAQGVKVKGFEQ